MLFKLCSDSFETRRKSKLFFTKQFDTTSCISVFCKWNNDIGQGCWAEHGVYTQPVSTVIAAWTWYKYTSLTTYTTYPASPLRHGTSGQSTIRPSASVQFHTYLPSGKCSYRTGITSSMNYGHNKETYLKFK